MEHEIDVNELAELLRGDATVIDVREPEEYAAAHVAGTQLVPMRELGNRLHEIDRNRPVYLFCRSGSRSGMVTRALAGAGVAAVNVRGGLEAWVASGRPVEVAR